MKEAICILSMLCFVIAKKRFKAWNNPYVTFNLLWVIVGFLILCGNTSVYKPSDTAMICVIVGILGFNVSAISRKFTFGTYNIFNQEYQLNIKKASLISIIVLIISLALSMKSIQSFLSGVSYSDIRNDYYTYDNTGSTILYYLREYLLEPMRYVVIISAIFSIFKKEYRSRLLVFNAIVCVLLQAISSGGRYILMNTFFMILCGALILNSFKLSIKKRIKVLILVALLGYGLVFLTNSRSTYLMQSMNISEKIYSTIYQYFAGSVTYLGEVIKNTPNIEGATFGINFFAGWLSPIFVILNFIGVLSYPQAFSYIGKEACKVLQIGPYLYYNAMPTVFGYFYIDGGLIFTFIEAWIWGYICRQLYKRADNGNLFFIALYILMFLQICNSSTRWFLYSTGYCLAFLYMRLIFNKRNL